jgi:hypothetical protein
MHDVCFHGNILTENSFALKFVIQWTNADTENNRVFSLEGLRVCQFVKMSLAFYGTEHHVSLFCSLNFTTGPYSEPI